MALEYFKQNIGKSMGNGPSPVATWLDGTLVAADEGTLTARYEVRREMCNPAMILHGGTAAMMMDDVMGATIFSLGETDFFTSINLNVDYLKAVRMGETVEVISQVVRRGRNVVHMESTIRNAQGDLVAKSSSNLLRTAQKVVK
jgi:acyl-coenzyme A thioesterase 13